MKSMQATGSFKVPRWDLLTKRKRKRIDLAMRLRAKYVFLEAAHAYIMEVIKLLPVLTGTTKKQFVAIAEYIRDEMLTIEQTYSMSTTDFKFEMDVPSGSIDITPTARQYPGSPMRPPMTPDPGKTYTSGKTYRGKKVHSRGEWRARAQGFTKGLHHENWSPKGGGMWAKFFFEFTVRVEDEVAKGRVDHYYPVAYQTMKVAETEFRKALQFRWPKIPFESEFLNLETSDAG